MGWRADVRLPRTPSLLLLQAGMRANIRQSGCAIDCNRGLWQSQSGIDRGVPVREWCMSSHVSLCLLCVSALSFLYTPQNKITWDPPLSQALSDQPPDQPRPNPPLSLCPLASDARPPPVVSLTSRSLFCECQIDVQCNPPVRWDRRTMSQSVHRTSLAVTGWMSQGDRERSRQYRKHVARCREMSKCRGVSRKIVRVHEASPVTST